MAAIRGKDTKPELVVRRAVHAAGLRFRLHHRDLPGSPDVVLSRIKTVVFVHGCFWHAHGCTGRPLPKTRREFWRAKLEANVDRDARVRYFLRAAGWHVHVIWECELKREAPLKRLVRTLVSRRLALGLLLLAWPLRAQEGPTLSCTASVLRGESVQCTLDGGDTHRVTVTGWRFNPSTGSPVIRRDSVNAPRWSGTMVVSGTVELRYRVGDAERRASAAVRVLPRDWSGLRAEEVVREVAQSQLPLRPRRMTDLGSTDLSAVVVPELMEHYAVPIRTGPNAGRWYLAGVPVRATARVDVNTPALAVGSEFWARHPTTPARSSGQRPCTRREIATAILRIVRAHEGTRGREDRDSHAARFFESLDADVVPRLEALVSEDGSFDDLPAMVQAFSLAAGARSQRMDRDGTNRAIAPCVPRFF